MSEDNKMSESKICAKWSESNMAEFNMDGCHHQFESEWMSEVFFVQNGLIHDGRIQDGCMAEFSMEEFKMVAIIKLIR